jgi:single-strand DNA-binding protein
MVQLNKVFLMGNLTRDPELRRVANGTAVVDLGLAVNRSYTGKDGERREEVVFIDVTVWDRQAETCCQYLKKGRPIHVEGYLKMDTWTDKTTGTERTKLKVQADRVQFLDRREDSGGGGPVASEDEYAAPAPAPRRPAPDTRNFGPPPARGFNNGGAPAPQPARRAPAPPVDSDGDDEDIPF